MRHQAGCWAAAAGGCGAAGPGPGWPPAAAAPPPGACSGNICSLFTQCLGSAPALPYTLLGTVKEREEYRTVLRPVPSHSPVIRVQCRWVRRHTHASTSELSSSCSPSSAVEAAPAGPVGRAVAWSCDMLWLRRHCCEAGLHRWATQVVVILQLQAAMPRRGPSFLGLQADELARTQPSPCPSLTCGGFQGRCWQRRALLRPAPWAPPGARPPWTAMPQLWPRHTERHLARCAPVVEGRGQAGQCGMVMQADFRTSNESRWSAHGSSIGQEKVA